eukprot:TRINITY_DN16319_c0_g1_i1.p1 TRINITY_DN16319_c0_g1~~TRINITY_DN16319_c0_g1_i1.p1  ORF type:complete len:139 (+),score=28.65 TRINITY_DN16319_c0_g1_i1:3-419(+)
MMQHWKINDCLIPPDIQAYTEQIRKQNLRERPFKTCKQQEQQKTGRTVQIRASSRSAFTRFSKNRSILQERGRYFGFLFSKEKDDGSWDDHVDSGKTRGFVLSPFLGNAKPEIIKLPGIRSTFGVFLTLPIEDGIQNL